MRSPKQLGGPEHPFACSVKHLDVVQPPFVITLRAYEVRISSWVVDAAADSGLADVTSHCLRHTYAALAVQAGANVKVLQKAMGHSDIRLTLDTYGGLTSAAFRKIWR